MLEGKPIGYMLGQTIRAYKNKLTCKMKENNLDLSFELLISLFLLSAEDEQTQQDLANHLQKDKSIILRQINMLIDKDYVVRVQDQEDKRKKNLILTDKANTMLLLAKDIENNVENELLTGIQKEEMEIFIAVLDKIQENGGFCEKSFH